jgi:rfaE bifunctional protein kinase chain/domain
MHESRLAELLNKFTRLRILVFGDFFLDWYLTLDSALTEISAETGLDALQVTATRPQPGGAGTVTSNLRALSINTLALGALGDDGLGLELRRALEKTGVDTAPLITVAEWTTCAYTKPMIREPRGGQRELNRLDFKNRLPMPRHAEGSLIERLRSIAPRVDGILVIDHATPADYGCLTQAARDTLASLGNEFPDKIIIADSRWRIGEFRSVFLKPNAREAIRAVTGETLKDPNTDARLEKCADELFARSGRGVIVTLAEHGMLVRDAGGTARLPTIPPDGEIDVVGCGDAAMAGIGAALCAGATLREAAAVGNLCAAVTIRQIGTTGTATREQLMDMALRFRKAGLMQ